MLFNSYLFICLFLPVTILGYYIIGKSKYFRFTTVWLIAASLVFYGWYNPIYLALISGSIIFNYFTGIALAGVQSPLRRKWLLAFGLAVNILLLGYFKYAGFFVDSVNTLFHGDFNINTVILPLAVSFFTIQQVSYLVDIYRGEVEKHTFADYCLFITFFPKLISGPITRFKEMMPQILKGRISWPVKENIAIGLTVFFLGLFKKVILADGIGVYAQPIFYIAAHGGDISFFNSWVGALSYTFQLYFDFSGYSDMAIGLGLLFGIRLPLNFYSPYKATSIIDFWRRWHITLSRFIRDYLYIPLGGNRKGFLRQMVNLLIAMTIAGFWHGAGLTFIIWGALHGLYLVINHSWRRVREKLRKSPAKQSRLGTAGGILVTFIAVSVAWVFFRADNLGAALNMIKSMAGTNGFYLPVRYHELLGPVGQFLGKIGISFTPVPSFAYMAVIWIFIALVICWFLPNIQEYMANYYPSLDQFGQRAVKPRRLLQWKPSAWNAVILTIFTLTAFLALALTSNFLYFKF